ncbi:MAG: DUF3784 domain-containing protein [Cellulosilyticaceae bacterium]
MFYACLSLSVIFVITAGLLTILGDKGAMLISGFNTFSEAQRNLYDKNKLVKAMRNSLLLWALILGIGAILSYLGSQYFGIISFIIWLIVFFKDFHWDAKKAFEKYKK